MLTPGVFATFLHYAFGQYSQKKADNLSLFFILGAEAMVVITFLFISIIIWALPLSIINFNNPILLWILVGIFVALSVAAFCFYFRKGKYSELFISRNTAKKFIKRAQFVKKRSDAFVFGLVSGVPELPFTLPLYFISALSIMNISISSFTCSSIMILFAFVSIIPLFIVYTFFKTGHNLADLIKFRTKNKTFFRFLISALYLVVAILFINLRGFIL